MDLTKASLIQSVYPGRYAADIPLNAVLRVTFIRDMNASTLDAARVIMETVGAANRITATLSYTTKVLSITPSAPLNPGTTYRVTVVGDNIAEDSRIDGVRDILGNGMRGDFVWTFTTSAIGVLAAPIQRTPNNQSALTGQPTFTWTAVTGADHYDIQVSLDTTWENTYWPVGTDSWDPTGTSVTPARVFGQNQEYAWRIRAVDSSNNPGVWSIPNTFYLGDPTDGVISPEDEPIVDFVSDKTDYFEVFSVLPDPEASNLVETNIPFIEIKIKGEVTLADITTETFTVTGFPTNMAATDIPYAPYWVPSLNGSEFIFVSGGFAAPAPVDSYVKIRASGVPTSATVTKSYDPITNITTARLIPDSEFFAINNRYIVVFNAPQLARRWWFTTRYTPCYSTVQYIRQDLGDFAAPFTDDEINFRLWDFSLLSLYLAKFPPLYIPTGGWYGINPVAVNVDNPPYYIKQFTRYKTGYELLRKGYLALITHSARKKLADLEYEISDLATDFKLVMAEMKRELDFWERKVKGMTLIGTTKPKSARRGGGLEQGRTWGYPLRNRGAW